MKKILYMLSFFALLSNAIYANNSNSQDEKGHRLVNLEPTSSSIGLARYEIHNYQTYSSRDVAICAEEIYDRIASICQDEKSAVKSVDIADPDVKEKVIRILATFLQRHNRKFVMIAKTFSDTMHWDVSEKEFNMSGSKRIVHTGNKNDQGIAKTGIEIKGIHKMFSPSNNCIEIRFLKEFD